MGRGVAPAHPGRYDVGVRLKFSAFAHWFTLLPSRLGRHAKRFQSPKVQTILKYLRWKRLELATFSPANWLAVVMQNHQIPNFAEGTESQSEGQVGLI